ncbi:MAG: type II toxin-antitoxin system PemK/MazF family toxin [Acidobacteriia bacterium]|nr:type II toxin-antitoxin system PemK/MazF family toxin [Terriglobia bacterium]
MRQFEIWWADLPRPAGRRPVLLLSRDDAYSYLNKFVVVEITTTIRAIPVEVLLGPRDGLPKPCVANCDNLRTVSRSALRERVSRLHPRREAEVKRALGYALGWRELIEAASLPTASPRSR